MKLSDYVIERIAAEGVKHVFMLPGGGAMHLNDSVGGCPSITHVSTLHEQAAAIAAEAYARVGGGLGVAVFTAGPGATNAVTGVAAAWLDSTPCLFVSGQAKRADLSFGTPLRQRGVQEIDIVSIVKPVTKYSVTIMEPSTIRFHLDRALFLARDGRPGPVWLDIPLDVQAAEIDPDTLDRFQPGPRAGIRSRATGSQLDEVIASIAASTRPLLLLGNGVRIAGACDRVDALIRQLECPVLTTRLGADLVPASNPLLVGMPGGIASRAANFALQNCDCLISIGARLDMALIAYAPERLARSARRIMVNIDPAEIDKLGAVIDVGIVSDAGTFIDDLLERAASLAGGDHAEWRARCAEWKQRYPFVLPEQRNHAAGLSMYAFSEALSDALAADDIVLPGSSGFACEIFLTALAVKAGQRVFHNKGTGAMGFGQPAAIGACLAAKRARTVCVDGDGGFQMNIQELETIRRLQLPIKFFVIDNDGYASIRSSQSGYFGRLTGADASSGMTLPDLMRVVEAYGIAFVDCAEPGRLDDAIRETLETPGPVVCRVRTLADEPRMPRVASMQRADGSMVSKPLEDMWPFLPREEFLANMLIAPLEE